MPSPLASFAWLSRAPARRSHLCLALAGLIVLLLFTLGARPGSGGGLLLPPWDKLAHFACYGLITWLLAAGLDDLRPRHVFAVVAAIGVFDEWHQAYLPGRSADLADLATDFAAALAVLTVLTMRAGRPAPSASATDAANGAKAANEPPHAEPVACLAGKLGERACRPVK